MSHFTKVKTRMKNLVCLKAALKDLGYNFTHGEQLVEVRGYRNNREKCDIAVHVSKSYDVGIKVTDEGTELVADWWGVETTRGVAEEQFVQILTQRYAYHMIKNEVKSRGFTLEEEEVKQDTTIQLKVRVW